ncbi:paraslipin [Oculatella sp. LEGE 06141]|uniref:SPFH domain-containing protein n=1 Tax=Oculatella sp. LEGE 06141 TaxID=1828648 RepID=UPI001881D953|nr:stomatin-like protein [Oculatella sp. LEGE 06141]MBE9177894.1 paraslipin [Oculatella sp. LEGE 06141]
MESILAALALLIIGYTIGSVKIVNQGSEALVERLGRYHRKLTPGLNFIVPWLDAIVLEDTTREQVLDIEPQSAITKDNVALQVDAVVFWRILDLERAFYAIEDIETALKNLVLTTLRAEIGQMEFEETFASRGKINKALLDQLDEATAPWGVKVTRVEVQDIEPAAAVLESMQLQRAAEIKRRAAVLEAEGDQEATIKKAEATVRSIEMLSKVMKPTDERDRSVLNFLLMQRYVDANQKLGESDNSKIIFMNPRDLSEALGELMSSDTNTKPKNGDSGNGLSPD